MTSDASIADWLVKLYLGPAAAPWDVYESGSGDSGICWALLKSPDEYLFLLRGSRTFEDWLRDFIALATPWNHPVFGECHPGFVIGMDAACDQMYSEWDKKTPIVFAGHSLGAGRSSIAVAEFLQRKVPASLMHCVLFGEPKPGMQSLADYIKDVPRVSYQNHFESRSDVVTRIPLTLPGEWYVHPHPLTPVSIGQDQGLSSSALHNMNLYAQAVSGLTAPL